MGEDEPVAKRACWGCEDDYFMDVYSFVQPGQKSQLCLYLTKGGGKGRQAFLQVSVKKKRLVLLPFQKKCGTISHYSLIIKNLSIKFDQIL